jgi:hypothetical protein
LSLGGNAALSVDGPGNPGGHFLVKGDGKVGINNPVPAAALDVVGAIRGDSLLSLGGTATLRVDAPGVIGGHFLVDGAGHVGIDNPAPASALDVTGNIHTTSLQIASDHVMSAAPRMYMSAYLPKPMPAGASYPLFMLPSTNIVITRMTVGGLNPCWAQGDQTFTLEKNYDHTVIAKVTVSGSAWANDTGPISVPIPGGISLDVEVWTPDCGFGSVVAPGNLALAVEYMMQ